MIKRIPLLLSVAALATAPAFAAEVPEAVKTAASATEKGLKKAEEAVVHGVQVAASSARAGMEKASEAVKTTAKKLGVPNGPATSSSAGLPAEKRKH
jgi:hypothetical protein